MNQPQLGVDSGAACDHLPRHDGLRRLGLLLFARGRGQRRLVGRLSLPCLKIGEGLGGCARLLRDVLV